MAANKIFPPPNGIYIVQGEIALVVMAMRRNSRWSSHSPQDEEQDPLLSGFSQLRDVINSITDLSEIDVNSFLSPFLDVIRSEDTTGPITGLALSSVNKFLSYALIDLTGDDAVSAVENVADAVTHARFVGTDPGSDEVVLMKILQVLRTLLLTPVGNLLSNESVCEIMQSCFRICFEMRLSELLRKSAEHTLVDMVQLLFSRLPLFKEEKIPGMKKLKLRAAMVPEGGRGKKPKRSPKTFKKRERLATTPSDDGGPRDITSPGPATSTQTTTAQVEISTSSELSISVSSDASATAQSGEQSAPAGDPEQSTEAAGEAAGQKAEEEDGEDGEEEDGAAREPPSLDQTNQNQESAAAPAQPDGTAADPEKVEPIPEVVEEQDVGDTEWVNPQGVRFTSHSQQQASQQHHHQHKEGSLIPYGLPCIRELFRFLVSLTNSYDRHNTDTMIHMGLSLLTVALETGADNIGTCNTLLGLVKDDMCRHLFMLLQSERLSLYAASLRVCFLLFESMREHLKFQLESFLTKLMEIIVSELPKISYEQKEMALESIVQLWRIPSLVSELYVNYDCDVYCTNLFEDLTKLLSKNTFPVSGLFTTHLLSLDSLLTVVDTVEAHCHSQISSFAKAIQDNQGPREAKEEASSAAAEDKSSEVAAGPAEGEDSGAESDNLHPPQLVTTGFIMAQANKENRDQPGNNRLKLNLLRRGKSRRTKFSEKIPTPAELLLVKHKKKLLQAGTEQFNQKPSKGIAFLQEHKLLKVPLDPEDVVTYLKENPRLDKNTLGDYLSSRKNTKVLEAFIKSFNFEGSRIDEALRLYLESFRLPGEAPVIQHLMEMFSAHWHECNGSPFANEDAAFTLTYAIIMLNVDQHNSNAKKQNVPMTVEDFKRNLNKTNGKSNFDPQMLETIYNAIKNDEIVMPAEQTGMVRENYLWRMLLRRGATAQDRQFIQVPLGSYHLQLFMMCWGPTVAAISFVFDKSLDEAITQRTISGFRKCAMVSAHYSLNDVFDNLIISLCKFTGLINSSGESVDGLPVSFGANAKAQLAAKTVFALAHCHGDILREGWKNILDCMLQLYRAKLLPDSMLEVEDFLDKSGKISLLREEMPILKSDSSGLFSSFYQLITLTPEPSSQKGPTPEDQNAIQAAHDCIKDCHPEHLVTESKFLREESLQELLKSLTAGSQGPVAASKVGAQYDQDSAVFYLELLIKVVLENRDRVGTVWQPVRDHFYDIVINASEYSFHVERAVVGLIRLAMRLLRKEEFTTQVLTSLRILLLLKPGVLHRVCRQIAFGLHELLRTNAADIHSASDWHTLFTLLECVGAGVKAPPILHLTTGVEATEALEEEAPDSGAQSDSEVVAASHHGGPPADTQRGYTSDSELYESQSARPVRSSTDTDLASRANGSLNNWHPPQQAQSTSSEGLHIAARHQQNHNQYEITIDEEISHHDTASLLKCCETLAFLVRDAAHVTPENFESCVHAIRVFIEANVHGGKLSTESKKHRHLKEKHQKHKKKKDSKKSHSAAGGQLQSHHAHENGENNEAEEIPGGYHSLSIQLLDLMHTLHTRAASIFSSWAEEQLKEGQARVHIDAGASALWVKCWCPLLQGIARLCCDVRKQVRMSALTYLQRALLVHDLQTLSAVEWESCFNKVLFPLMAKLLENINLHDPLGMEETRMRASTLLCKVFLQHLAPLLSLTTFTALWLTILDFMDKYMHKDKSDLLYEAIPESLKNMLLVMDTAHVFQNDGNEQSQQLWMVTWERINCFLPGLKDEVFKPSSSVSSKSRVLTEPNQDCAIPRDSPLPGPDPGLKGDKAADGEDVAAAAKPANTSQGNIILQPPLPSPTSPASPAALPSADMSGTIPILLNPQVIQGTPVPILAVSQAPPTTQ